MPHRFKELQNLKQVKKYINPAKEQWEKILARPVFDFSDLEAVVQPVLDSVRNDGDTAIKQFTERFDKVALENFQATGQEIESATQELDSPLKSAIQIAKVNIERFHTAQREVLEPVETMPGVKCWRKSIAIEKVGLYIPGGTAPLFSTILMLGVPAMIAGCKEIILCTPPKKDGSIHPAILYTAKLVGITRIFKVGGAQAIAGMSYGTKTIPQVYKIFGPGNQYVTMAKQLVNKEGIAIDMPAGPSEVLVYADENAYPEFVAADLLSQAEHGVDSQVILLTETESMVIRVQEAVKSQLEKLPRKEITAKALDNSAAVVVKSKNEALDLINFYAPEHLILASDQAHELANKVANAGSIFLGHFTPESVGDYASGTNHTLPTNGYAKMYSGVSLDSFVKKITYQQLTVEGLKNIGKTVELMAAAEALEAHKNAVSLRLSALK